MNKTIKVMSIFIMVFCGFLSYNVYCSNDAITIFSDSAIVVDLDSEDVLFEKNGSKRVFPASTTKLLTAILAVENLKLDDVVVVSKNQVDSTPKGSSVMYLKENEVISVKNLLYGLLLMSGNDAAIVLAEKISGSIDDFSILMNKKLKEIGCANTNFTNPHGFHSDNHYTTPNDMVKIFKYALKNDEIVKIINTIYYEMPGTNVSEKRKMRNTNLLVDIGNENYYEYSLGGKTGYTSQAGGTFIGYASKNDLNLITAVFNGPEVANVKTSKFEDFKKLCDYVFNNFINTKIIDKNNYTFNFVDNKNNIRYIMGIDKDFFATLKKDISYKTNYVLDIDTNKLNKNSLDLNIGTVTINIFGNDVDLNKTFNLKVLSYEKIQTDKIAKGINWITDNVHYILIISGMVIITLSIIAINVKTRNNYIIYKNEKNDKDLDSKD